MYSAICDNRSAKDVGLRGSYQDRNWKYVFRENFNRLSEELQLVPDVRRAEYMRMLRQWVAENVPYFAGD